MQSITPSVLVFSGLDPSGGAGIQADIETLASHGCHACPIITALTVQDTSDIKSIKPVDPQLVIHQAECVLADIDISAIKIGLIGNTKLIHELAEFIKKIPNLPIILDPVLSSGGGTSIADSQYVNALVTELLPIAHFVTPNHLEARTMASILGCRDLSNQHIAQVLLKQHCNYLLITGGHEESTIITNQLFHENEAVESFQWRRLTGNFHGSGCTLASSIAGLIAQGHSPYNAIHEAQEYTWSSLKHAYPIGQGQLIPNRFFWAHTGKDHHS